MQDNMSRGGETSPHAVYAIAFTVVAVVALIALLFVVFNRSQADDVSQSTAVTNAAPAITSITTAETAGATGTDITSKSVTENTTGSIYVYGAAEDPNGCSTINAAGTNWTSALYRTTAVNGSACTDDNNDCYQATESTDVTLSGCTGAGDLNLVYETAYTDLQYYGDPTDTGAPSAATNWTSYEKVDDGALNASLTDTWEFNSTIALDVTSSVNYGTIALNGTSTEQTIVFTNTGNRNIDADQTASGNMTCTGSGSSGVDVGQARYNFTSGFSWAGAGIAFATSTTNFNMSLAQRTSESTASTKNTYLLLVMPATGVGGTCTNTVTFTAKADA